LARDRNSVFLKGRLTADAEVKTFDSGNSVAEFRLATSRRVNKGTREKPDWQDEPSYHNVKVWRPSDGLVKALKKGTRLDLENGYIDTRKWTDKEGNNRYTTEITFRSADVDIIDNRGESNGNGNAAAEEESDQPSASASAGAPQPSAGDTIPF